MSLEVYTSSYDCELAQCIPLNLKNCMKFRTLSRKLIGLHALILPPSERLPEGIHEVHVSFRERCHARALLRFEGIVNRVAPFSDVQKVLLIVVDKLNDLVLRSD